MVGSGLYADKDAGAAVATGDGEEVQKANMTSFQGGIALLIEYTEARV